MTVTPAPGYALVKIVNGEYKTQSGLVLSASTDEFQRGVLVAVGGTEVTPHGRIEFPFAEKDRIIFSKGMDFNQGGLTGTHKLIHRQNVVARVVEE